MPTLTYPGVYIEEFTPGAPIEGVGTSTAAFIGVAGAGELDTPTKVTSWDQFKATFGADPVPGFYLWYAVRGFFENGGQVCYVVRASNGKYDGRGYGVVGFDALKDRANNAMLRVRARQPGANTPPLEIRITKKHLINETDGLFRPKSTYTKVSNREIELPDDKTAAQFRAGDLVKLRPAGSPLQILSINGNRLRLATELTEAADPAGMQLADAEARKTRVLRLKLAAAPPPGALVAGTVLTIEQGTGASRVVESAVIHTVQAEPLATASPTTTFRVTFRGALTKSFSFSPTGPAVSIKSEELDIEFRQGAGVTSFQNAGVDPAHPLYFLSAINDANGSVLIEPIEPPPPVSLPDSLPNDTGGVFLPLGGGKPEDLATIDSADFTEALDTLREVDDVNLVAAPERVKNQVQNALLDHCQLLADRFAVLDALPPAPGQPLFGANSVEGQRPKLDSLRGYGALYYPWLRVPAFGAGSPVLVPPSGHVCGIIARSDNLRGVHKAPANEIVNGAVGVERTMSDIDHGQLNIVGINVIRIPQGGGRPYLFGARTTATDSNWRYVNIRRLFLFLEESIQEGIRWAIFEPNNLQLWQKLKRTITEFLTRVWRDGALFGAKPEDAFYVRIDDVLNPFSEQALGRLHIEIGIRPTYPAEFIVVRIGIWPGGSEVSES